jgi:hypothetical protein
VKESKLIQPLIDYYRIPEDVFSGLTPTTDSASASRGFFRFGSTNICYGHCETGTAANIVGSEQFDALKDVRQVGSALHLPFDFAEVIDNLRLERYRQGLHYGTEIVAASSPARSIYYFIREFLPVSIRRKIQRAYFRDWKKLPFPAWPVDFTVDNLHEEFIRLLIKSSNVQKVPFVWFWPEGAPNCLIMTHDVETSAGRDFSSKLMDLDESRGLKASFQVIPEQRYSVPDEYVHEMRRRGFEFNVHDLNHDGSLFRDRAEFESRAARVNHYVHRYDAKGFRAGAMYRNQDWFKAFKFSYDMSVPNVAHLEPMRGGCCTVMPYFIGNIVELPLTAAQDYSLFHILRDYSIDLWKQQLALLRAKNGLISFITHPDYLINLRARKIYEMLLDYLRQMVDREKIWAALPRDVDQWWRARNQMKLVRKNDSWSIEGPEAERARIAFASIQDDHLVYEVIDASEQKAVLP